MTTLAHSLLIEIGAEEYPPKSLRLLAQTFAEALHGALVDANLTSAESAVEVFAAPRRLAVRIADVLVGQPDQTIERLGPAVKAAYDGDGNPTRAAQGFARGLGVEVDQLKTFNTDKGERIGYRIHEPGKSASELVPAMVEGALAKLPVPKPMRWGSHDYSFVRPVHWIVGLHGEQVLGGKILGCQIGGNSRGHRFHHPDNVSIGSAHSYEERLRDAHVEVSMERREQVIREGANAVASELGGQAVLDDGLVEENVGLVEWPVCMHGSFDESFLRVPPEALMSSMENHQKFFPVVDADGQLMPSFILVSNIDSKDPSQVRSGFEKVITPRLADAQFFWDQDRKRDLGSRSEDLGRMIYQKDLGTLLDKSRRVARLAEELATEVGTSSSDACRAAELAKCDLLTEMVGEFPELQGIMGRHYALAQGEPQSIAAALEEQYLPRHASDSLPQTDLGRVLAIAERLDTLAGIFAVGMRPTGNKDPFALRRAALGLARITLECQLDLDVRHWFQRALHGLDDQLKVGETVLEELLEFLFDRLAAYYADRGVSKEIFLAVMALRPTRLLDFDARIRACQEFAALDEAQALAAANKRIGNILAKADASGIADTVDAVRLESGAETALWEAMAAVSQRIQPLMEAREYRDALVALAALREPVDTYFDDVMVMVDDETLRANRLAMLRDLKRMFDQIADIAQMARA